jgi:RNA polymerase II C-terminal domain phosphatase-like 3/4
MCQRPRNHADVGDPRLNLVLDLDHTLVHSVPIDYLSAVYGHAARFEQLVARSGDMHRNRVSGSWIKVRPGTFQFLEAMSEVYTLHVYTMGSREYAEEVRAILDPTGALFGDRVVSRCDTPGVETKDLAHLKLEPANTLIVDDTPAVWPAAQGSLVQIGRYQFFPASPGDEAGCLFSRGCDESDVDNNLAHIRSALEKLHARLGGMLKVDAPRALQEHKRGVLARCVVYVDRNLAVAEYMRYTGLVKALGATCTTKFGGGEDAAKTARVTHYIAGDTASASAILARNRSLHVVTPDWLKQSHMFLTHMREPWFTHRQM